MKAPVFAAFAPGVLVVGRMVSATSSRNAISSGVNVPASVAPGFFSSFSRHPVISALPPTSATPPSITVTRRTASRRVIISRSVISSFEDIDDSPLEVAAVELTNRIVSSSRCERHVCKRRIHARGRRHPRAVSDKHIRRVPHLIVRVEHGSFWIASHSGRAHLVNPHSGEVWVVVRVYLLRPALLENLGHVGCHVLPHQALVFTRGAIDLENRHTPFVFFRWIERYHVCVIRQHLAESCCADAPISRYRQRVLELRADAE